MYSSAIFLGLDGKKIKNQFLMANLKNQMGNNGKKLMLNRRGFYVICVVSAMHRFSRPIVVPSRGTPHSELRIGAGHLYCLLMRLYLASLMKYFEENKDLSNKISVEERSSLFIFLEEAFRFLKKDGVFIIENLKDQVLGDSLRSLVQVRELTFEALTFAIQQIANKYYKKMGVYVADIIKSQTISNALETLFLDNHDFMVNFHMNVWNVFFQTDLQSANRRALKLNFLENNWRTPAQIFAQNAVFNPQRAPDVPAAPLSRLQDTPVQTDHTQVKQNVPEIKKAETPMENVHVLPDSSKIDAGDSVQLSDRSSPEFVPSGEDAEQLFLKISETSLPQSHANGSSGTSATNSPGIQSLMKSNADLSRISDLGRDIQSLPSGLMGNVDEATSNLRDLLGKINNLRSNDAASMFTSESLEVAVPVNDAAKADKSLSLETHNLNSLVRSVETNIQPSSPVDIIYVPGSPTDYFPPASSKIPSSKPPIPGNAADSAHLFEAINSPIPHLPGQPQFDHQNHANGAGGLFPVIPEEEEEDGVDQSGKSSPSQLVKDELLLPLSLSLRRKALKTEPSELNTSLHGAILQASPPSGPSGTPQTHELAVLLANQPILSLSSSTTAHAKLPSSFRELPSKDVSPLAQSSGNPSGILPHFSPSNLQANSRRAPPLPPKTQSIIARMKGGGAQSSVNLTGILPKIVHSNVGVRRNPYADELSSELKGKVGGSPVQELAQSVDPLGYSGGADNPKTQSSSKLGSNSSVVVTTPSASLIKVPVNSGRSKLFRLLQSRSSSSSEMEGIGSSSQEKHLSNNESENDDPPPLPSSISPLGGEKGGSPPAHSLGDLPRFVHSPAPSSRYNLGSAATAALTPQSGPSGHDIDGTNCDGVGSQFVEFAFFVLKNQRRTAQQSPPPLWTPRLTDKPYLTCQLLAA
jgi:hypothetical protein